MLSGKLWEQSGEFTALPAHLQDKLQEFILHWISGFHWPSQLMQKLTGHYVGNRGQGKKFGVDLTINPSPETGIEECKTKGKYG